jgi:cyclic pyranopterin phosphate synthase
MKDTYGRKIDYLRISLTDRCNLRCLYCMPAEGIPQVPHEAILTYDEIIELVRVAASIGIHHIRLTGGEPLVRKGIVPLVKAIHAIDGIKSISMTTNGILLPKYAHDLKLAGLDRVNISLDTLDPARYHEITRCGSFDAAVAGIKAALEEKLDPVKINAVAIRSLDQDFFAFARYTIDMPLHVRFIEYMPVGNSRGVDGCGWGADDVISCEEIIAIINQKACDAGMQPLQPIDKDVPEGRGPARYYSFPGAKGTVGFISPLSNHFCSTCNRIRLTSEGMIRPCLFSDQEFDIRAALRHGDEGDVRSILLNALAAKPGEHHEGDHARATTVNMNTIGG